MPTRLVKRRLRFVIVTTLCLCALLALFLGSIGVSGRKEAFSRFGPVSLARRPEKFWAILHLTKTSHLVFRSSRWQLYLSYRFELDPPRSIRRLDYGLAGIRVLVDNLNQGALRLDRTAHIRLTTPVWAVVGILMSFPFWTLLRGPVRRLFRRWRGRCLRCGYDLRGNESGICPECGEEVSDTR